MLEANIDKHATVNPNQYHLIDEFAFARGRLTTQTMACKMGVHFTI